MYLKKKLFIKNKKTQKKRKKVMLSEILDSDNFEVQFTVSPPSFAPRLQKNFKSCLDIIRSQSLPDIIEVEEEESQEKVGSSKQSFFRKSFSGGMFRSQKQNKSRVGPEIDATDGVMFSRSSSSSSKNKNKLHRSISTS